MHENAKWHWGEGFKYALEASKTLFIINGAAAISILTFIGNTKSQIGALIWSMVSFALGALAAAIVQLLCYLTQLQYGNESQISDAVSERQSFWKSAKFYHRMT